MKRLYFFLIIILTFTTNTLTAQTAPTSTLDVMRSSGKIYVVVAVVLVILSGLFFYVWRLDRKISKMEKDV